MPKRTPEQTFRYNRAAYCKAKFGITSSEYERILSGANRCEICADPFGHIRKVLDHNHDTQQPRGVLCDRCNKGIGLLKDSPLVALSAARYLKKYGHYGNTDAGREATGYS